MATAYASIKPILDKSTRIQYLRPDKPGHQVIKFYPELGIKLSQKEIDLLVNFICENLPSIERGNVTDVPVVGNNHIVINIRDTKEKEIEALKNAIKPK